MLGDVQNSFAITLRQKMCSICIEVAIRSRHTFNLLLHYAAVAK